MPYRIRAAVFGLFCLSFFVIFFFCGKTPSPVEVENYGMLEIRANVVSSSLNKESAQAQTIAENLIVEVSGEGMETVQITRKLDLSRPALSDTINKMPVGKNLRVSIWAVGKNGAVTHIDSLEYHIISIETSRVTPIVTTLIPTAGSIYLQLAGLGTDVGFIYASFTSFDENFFVETSVKRDSKTFVSLDYIPHLTTGNLLVIIKGVSGDTLQTANKELAFNARSDNNIDLQFIKTESNLNADITIYESGVTVISHDFSTKNPQNLSSTESESGELIITEIMWSASDSNYIELYNTTNDTLFFDTLTTDIDGTVRHFDQVKIAPSGYLVIGRINLLHVDLYPTATGGLPIASTGNWITIKRGDGTVINQVICAGSNKSTGWPQVSGKRSIELAKDKYNAQDNKFGKNWRAATHRISDDLNQYGTPGF
ncbi:MAG: lamin tail domain-containing protein [Chitinispirillales bacterium]|jgi:hypothetical protein|nr:lamin tail domain-containing protein [Chitinispirillales bacterium]